MKLSKLFGVCGWVSIATVLIAYFDSHVVDITLFNQPSQVVIASGFATLVLFVLSQSFSNIESNREFARH